MRVGFVYNVRSADVAEGDEDAEFDEPETIEAISNAIAAHGHDVIGLEADRTLPTALAAADVEVVFNIAEGKGQRGREAQVPALLELLGIPFTGSDAVTLGITLDKPLASTLVRAAFEALGCRDVARLDFRLDEAGVPHFLECNPLPGLAPGVGDLTFIAEADGLSFEDLIGEILAGALRRCP